jgi:hypothetical protein
MSLIRRGLELAAPEALSDATLKVLKEHEGKNLSPALYEHLVFGEMSNVEAVSE